MRMRHVATQATSSTWQSTENCPFSLSLTVQLSNVNGLRHAHCQCMPLQLTPPNQTWTILATEITVSHQVHPPSNSFTCFPSSGSRVADTRILGNCSRGAIAATAAMGVSMNVVVGVGVVVSTRRQQQVHLGCAARLGGLRLKAASPSRVTLRSSSSSSSSPAVVVCAEEGVTDKVKATAAAAKDNLETVTAAAKSKLDNGEGKAQNVGEDACDSRKRNVGNAMSGTVYSGKGIEEKINWNRPQLAYVIVYAPDVNKAAEFYNKAFGLEIRPQNKSNSWVEMETGATTLAFTPEKQHETELTGGVSSLGNNNNRIVINLDFSDVEAAYEHAVAQGATPVARPEEKSWPQKVGYVKDMDGNIVRLGSFPAI